MKLSHCAHVEQKGVYALAWDGYDAVFIGTASDAAIYKYTISSGIISCLCQDFTDQPFVYSLAYSEGYCYAGMGSNADLIAVDVVSGSYKSILPDVYRDDSFVYDISGHQGFLYFILSPSYRVISFNPQSNEFADTGYRYRDDTCNWNEALVSANHFDSFDLAGDTFVLLDDAIVGQLTRASKASYFDPSDSSLHVLDISGYYSCFSNDSLVRKKDLSKWIEKEYVAPTEFQVRNGYLYMPERRFLCWNRDEGEKGAFLVRDEPQASLITEEGIFTANYTDCAIYYYTFAVFGKNPESVDLNSEEYLLADIEGQCRPYQMDVSSNGRYLVLGSGPLYGQFGGAVSVYDLKNDELCYTHKNVIENHLIQAVCCSGSCPTAVWLGTSPYGENTSPAYLEEPSHLILWDIAQERALLDIVPEAEMKKIASIVELDGTVYCVTQAGHIVAFDANTGKQVSINQRSRINELIATHDGVLFGIDPKTLYSVDSSTLETEPLISGFDELQKLTEDGVTGDLYMFDSINLISVDGKSVRSCL